MRWFTPVVFILAGFWLVWTNGQDPNRVMTLPFMDMLSATLQDQGRYSAYLCWLIGGGLLLKDLIVSMTSASRPNKDP